MPDYTSTTYLAMQKPTVADSVGNWGAYLNANLDLLDLLMSQRLAPMRAGLWYATPAATIVTLTPANGSLRLFPIWVPRSLTMDRIGVEVVTTVGTAGAVFRAGIYKDISQSATPGPAGYPGDRVADFGTVTTTTLGSRDIDINQALTPGLYWIGGAFQGTPTTHPTVYGGALAGLIGTPNLADLNALNGGFKDDTITGALPATFTATPAVTSGNFRVAFKVA